LSLSIGKDSATEPKPDYAKEVMIHSMHDAAEIVAAVPDLRFHAEDGKAFGFSLLIFRPHIGSPLLCLKKKSLLLKDSRDFSFMA
jgi:hypothetical protein